jgi:LmbE family N-acetylglucosaminyl deacetylase
VGDGGALADRRRRVLSLGLGARRPSILALGCHGDDVEIGCGGTLLTLLAAKPGADVTWVVLGAEGERAGEARRSAEAFLAGAGEAEVRVTAFRDSFFTSELTDVKELFEELKAAVRPDVIFTHARHDRHQDHRLVSDLTWQTWRDHLVLEYEIPKVDGDLVTPNLYVPLTEEVASRKTELLLAHFRSQRGRPWFTEDLFRGLMRIRGMEACSPTGLAEGFTARKAVLVP